MPSLCRDCLNKFDSDSRCPACGSPRVSAHPELFRLSVAHMDCDAFYAAVEKRDDPSLADKPVIVGGRKRGVVSTACYIARIQGVHSAMPMFKALQRCPDAVVVRPRMEAYSDTSRKIRKMMDELTPAIEPLSLDEAFIDLTGTARLHDEPPALLLARLSNRLETELGITASIGLSHNKFLAKVASDLDKPRGFSIIGKEETMRFLAEKPVGLIWGVGARTSGALAREGISTFGDLRRWDKKALAKKFGTIGTSLWHLSRGEDARRIKPDRAVKSISCETTFEQDVSEADILEGHIWRLSERVSDRAKAKSRAGRVVTLKMKRCNHAILTRRTSLDLPTQMADKIFGEAYKLFCTIENRGPFRLAGVGISEVNIVESEEHGGSLLDPMEALRFKAERATDEIRKKFGSSAILRGRSLR
ncbi:MAG: DNA polymerase IV [Albidovulum sp.]|nr:DNA polymerase IV [Albidovulum sp.]